MTLVRFSVVFLVTALAAHGAHAQSAEAEMLFRDGRRMIKAGNLETGCAKIEASEKLETSIGTLLNLGDCREKLGRHASAWAAFRKAEAIAKRKGGDDKRRNEASKRALALESKLSQLVVMVTTPIDGLVIKRGDEVIDRAVWSSPMPLDPATYTIVAEAPGYKPWHVDVVIDAGTKRKVVSVPALERAPITSVPAPQTVSPSYLDPTAKVAAVPSVNDRIATSHSRWTTTRKISLGFAVVGVAALGAGGYFGFRAKDLEDRANERCPTSTCDDMEGLRLNSNAQTAARNANIGFVAGGVAVGTSLVLWFVGGPDDEIRVRPNVGFDHAGVSIGGKF